VTGAVALTVVLVIVVIGLSLAMQNQQTVPGARPARAPKPPRPPSPPRRMRERKAQPPASDMPAPSSGPTPADLGIPAPDLLRTGEQAEAKVISVVDERTIGPVTRSRLTVQVTPAAGEPFEVTTRVAFPTPEARARVKVGGTVKVRYDLEDRSRVVVDVAADAPEPPPQSETDGTDTPPSP
jgi:hypothetical protein